MLLSLLFQSLFQSFREALRENLHMYRGLWPPLNSVRVPSNCPKHTFRVSVSLSPQLEGQPPALLHKAAANTVPSGAVLWRVSGK